MPPWLDKQIWQGEMTNMKIDFDLLFMIIISKVKGNVTYIMLSLGIINVVQLHALVVPY
jgi:hypothetical protein